MEFKELVEKYRKEGVEIDRPVEEFEGFAFGDEVRVIEDDEEQGAYAGDEGIAMPEEVGSVEHGNLQVKMYVLVEGYDSTVEVDPDNLEQR
jgi:hypothetical protein